MRKFFSASPIFVLKAVLVTSVFYFQQLLFFYVNLIYLHYILNFKKFLSAMSPGFGFCWLFWSVFNLSNPNFSAPALKPATSVFLAKSDVWTPLAIFK